ncbi:MAG: NUDIX hydrolase [Chloroflexales bacterium]|jgi:8-oxo-dGTP pyrophosphatase MutT (NUDIX family)
MSRIVRYQGAIVCDHHILLIQHTHHPDGRSYWLIPGGGIEPEETEEACVIREMWEETCLQVRVEGLLLDEPAEAGGLYQRRKTYHCAVEAGEARPGYEPEPDAAAAYAITDVAWLDLRTPAAWPAAVVIDPITHPLLQRLRTALGYDASV